MKTWSIRPISRNSTAGLDETIQWWQNWSGRTKSRGKYVDISQRSALILKGLSYAPTGAIAAAATTSLPEWIGGSRNWDYRFSWIRDSYFTVRSLAELGHVKEADGFRRFIERSAAGSAEEIQVFFGVGGERRLIRTSGGSPGRLPQITSGPHRQCRRNPNPAGCLRGTAWVGMDLAHAGALAGRRLLGVSGTSRKLRSQTLGPTRSGHLGNAGRAAPFCPVQGNVLVRIGSRHPPGRGSEKRGALGEVERRTG